MSIIEDIKLQYKIGGVANKMIYWNVGIYLLSIILFYQFKTGVFEYPNWLAVSSNPDVLVTRPWTLLTYAFFHYGFLHIFFNMMVLNFTSRLFLTFFTQKQYLGLYFLSAIFASIIFVLSFYLLGKSSLMVGASAAIMALLVASTTYQPLMEVRLLLIGNVKLWHITAVILILDLMQIQLDNIGGHIAHLSGAFFGFLYIKLLQNGTDLSVIVTNTINFFSTIFDKKQKTPFKKVHKTSQRKTPIRESKVVIKDKTQQQIDEILDKISQSGYDSLTKEEKEFLFQSGK
ncbi:MAG TPA: rhomboid family intramembrane serine protease [Flavobacterium sp.]|jgi:membrane associated rhomboid family serine protease|uniref:rhomboid family intramembrane serine protease n=1 Tax=Flavobacterium sp. TaxID=239 RepID=UPI002C7F9197|nr:rhomboid family intramembrane serine protease [Flavobacterium sp.]MCA0347955.1 rhomboid family intramembrane serine protease [Bacteroidota bacterium]HPW96951.1 rhomboid family intramembrane serine protease [Flavobacterium sp.]HQA74513.1 rhomboid family intramembrane serine protease [Flavobacterium sp.]